MVQNVFNNKKRKLTYFQEGLLTTETWAISIWFTICGYAGKYNIIVCGRNCNFD